MGGSRQDLELKGVLFLGLAGKTFSPRKFRDVSEPNGSREYLPVAYFMVLGIKGDSSVAMCLARGYSMLPGSLKIARGDCYKREGFPRSLPKP